jgi:hypothetical protein
MITPAVMNTSRDPFCQSCEFLPGQRTKHEVDFQVLARFKIEFGTGERTTGAPTSETSAYQKKLAILYYSQRIRA